MATVEEVLAGYSEGGANAATARAGITAQNAANGPVSSGVSDALPAPAPPIKTPRKPRGADVSPLYGRRKMKWYPISRRELQFLGIAEGASAFAFAIAAGCGTFALDLTKDFALAASVPPTAAVWDGYRIAAIIGAVVFVGIGAALQIWRQSTINEIKRDTTFDE